MIPQNNNPVCVAILSVFLLRSSSSSSSLNLHPALHCTTVLCVCTCCAVPPPIRHDNSTRRHIRTQAYRTHHTHHTLHTPHTTHHHTPPFIKTHATWTHRALLGKHTEVAGHDISHALWLLYLFNKHRWNKVKECLTVVFYPRAGVYNLDRDIFSLSFCFWAK